MKKAFVDTTILVDLLLKSGQQNARAKAALKQFDTAELPVYAIKELSAGPLQYFAWLHNKFVVLGSYAETIDALQRMSRSPKRYLTSTASGGGKRSLQLGNDVKRAGRGIRSGS